jgi:hypothetical protein
VPLPLPYFKVNICPFPLTHFASIFFAYLWSFRWPNYIVTLPRYFSFRTNLLESFLILLSWILTFKDNINYLFSNLTEQFLTNYYSYFFCVLQCSAYDKWNISVVICDTDIP